MRQVLSSKRQISSSKEATKKPVSRNIKAVLHHLNGSIAEINLTTPVFTMWGEPCERASSYLRDYIFELTRCFIQITHFEIYMETVWSNGEHSCSCCPFEYEIPLNKIYQPGDPGEWVTLGEAKDINDKKLAEYQHLYY